MKPWIWLRIGAALQALGVVGHNLETLSTRPAHGPQEQAVFDAMRGFQFDIMGASRSTWDFYRGYQFATTVNFLLMVAILWLLSNLSRRAPEEARPFVWVMLLAQVAGAVLGWEFFFAGPGLMGGLIAGCIAIALAGLYLADQPMLQRQQSVNASMAK